MPTSAWNRYLTDMNSASILNQSSMADSSFIPTTNTVSWWYKSWRIKQCGIRNEFNGQVQLVTFMTLF